MAPGLPAPLTLRLYRGEDVLFESAKRWLHPLFDLEAFLRESGQGVSGTRLVDRVTGRGAAFLVAHLGIPELHTHLLSRRAIPVLERHGVRFTFDREVDRILCATEDLLAETQDRESACALLRERRARSLTATQE